MTDFEPSLFKGDAYELSIQKLNLQGLIDDQRRRQKARQVVQSCLEANHCIPAALRSAQLPQAQHQPALSFDLNARQYLKMPQNNVNKKNIEFQRDHLLSGTRGAVT